MGSLLKSLFDWVVDRVVDGVGWVMGTLGWVPNFDPEPLRDWAEFVNYFVPLDVVIAVIPSILIFESTIIMWRWSRGLIRWV